MRLSIDTTLLQLLGGIEKGRRDDDKVHVAGSYRLAPYTQVRGGSPFAASKKEYSKILDIVIIACTAAMYCCLPRVYSLHVMI